MYKPDVIGGDVMAASDLVVLVGADPMMTHLPWSATVATCELVARPEYETLSPDPKLRVNGDLKASLKGLLSLKQEGFGADEVQACRRKVLAYFARPDNVDFAAQDVLEIMRAVLPADGVFVSETGVFVLMLEHLWPVSRPGTYYGTAGGRTMGLTLPAILGAKLAAPDVPMIGLGGDGSLLMRLGELECFARRGVAVPLVIINDQALGTIKSKQKTRGMPDHGLDLHPVDFAAVANACGLRGVTVTTPESFEKELKAAMAADRTTLIDARVEPRSYQEAFALMRH